MACLSSCANIDGHSEAGHRRNSSLPHPKPSGKRFRQALCAAAILLSLSYAMPAIADELPEYSAGSRHAAGRHRGELHKRRLRAVMRPRFSMRSLNIPQLPVSAGGPFADSAGGPGQSVAGAMHGCPRLMRRQMICAAFNDYVRPSALPDALIVPPNAETMPTIAAIGIPAIEGVPPIMFLEDHQRAAPTHKDPGRMLNNAGSP
jgi:hypothetical protein